jgi:hypothetical protein
MGRCSVGRSTQKYTSGGGGGADLSSILTAHGDMIYADSTATAANVPIGQTTGHVLTVVAPGEVGWQGVSGASGQVGTLQQVTTNAPTTTVTTQFLNTVTSLTASGNVLVTGIVTASKFIGDGSELTGVALVSDLNDNSSRISDIETATIISNSSTITTGFQTGDILYASADNVLNKLSIGSTGEVLKSDGTVPVWGTDIGGSSGTAVWTATGVNGRIHYSSGNVGIGVSNPQHLLDLPSSGTVNAGFFIGDGSGLYNLPMAGSQWTGTTTLHFDGPVGIGNTTPLTTQTLQVGSNVSINDSDDDKIVVTGNVYVSKNIRVLDDVDCFQVRTTNIFIKKQIVSAQSARSSSAMVL